MTQTLEQRLDYYFNNRALLNQALTHRSVVGADHNERLEFLGDALLSAIISDTLFRRYPQASEGELSRMRSALVCGDHLATLAQQLALDTYLQLGMGEQRSGGHRRPSLLANAFEALIGALYLDGGIDCCRQIVLRIYGDFSTTLTTTNAGKDAKSRLQEWSQAHRLPLPTYQATVSGKAHAQTFHVVCQIDGLDYKTTGFSNSRRKAEQVAAHAFLEQLLSESTLHDE